MMAEPDTELRHLQLADRHLEGVRRRIAVVKDLVTLAEWHGWPLEDRQHLLANLETSLTISLAHRVLIVQAIADAGA